MPTANEFELFAQVNRAISNEWLQESALLRACRAAVEMFNVDHSAIVVFDDTSVGTVVAEFPEDFGAINATIETRNIPAEQRLLLEREDINYPDLNLQNAIDGFGALHAELLSRGIRAILAVPIFRGGQVIGSFSLDSETGPREFTDEERAKTHLLASMIGAALHNIQLAKTANQIDAVLLGDPSLEWIEKRIADAATRFLDVPEVELRRVPVSSISPSPIHVVYAEDHPSGLHEIRARLGPAEQPWGELIVKSAEAPENLSSEIRKLEHLARYGYVALERARLVRQERLLRNAGDIINQPDETDRAVEELCTLLAYYFEAEFCRILVSDTGGVELHNLAGNAKGRLDRRAATPHAEEPSLLQRLAAARLDKTPVVISRDPKIGNTQLLPLLDAMAQDLEGNFENLETAWLFPLCPTTEVRAWILLAGPALWDLSDGEPSLMANDLAQRIEGYIARMHLQAAEKRQRGLVNRLIAVIAQSRDDLSFEKQLIEITHHAVAILEADGAAVVEIRPEAGCGIRLWHHPEAENFAWRFSLTPDLAAASKRERPSSIPMSPELRREWGAGFAGKLGGVACAPLRVNSPDNSHALIVWRHANKRAGREIFSKGELDILGLYAARASVLLSQVGSQALRVLPAELELLSEFSEFALSAGEANIYRACLTAVTAGYGLRLNRAAILLLAGGATAPQLYGEDGIGAMSLGAAESDWSRFHSSGPNTYRNYLDALRSGQTERTQLGLRMAEVRMTLQPNSADPLFETIENGMSQVRASREFSGRFQQVWYGDHVHSLNGGEQIAVIPLRGSGGVAGVLIADNWHTAAPIEQRDLFLAERFASVAAKAAAATRSGPAAETLVLELHNDPARILEDLISELHTPYRDSGAAVILITDDGRPRFSVAHGIDKPEAEDLMRAEGVSISLKVWKTGRREVIPDRSARSDVNSNMNAFRASVCFPLATSGGVRLGVAWLHLMEVLNEAEFNARIAPPLEARIQQYADAYVRSWQAREDELLHTFKLRIGDPKGPRAAEEAIVSAARDSRSASHAFLLAADATRAQFLESRAVADSPAPESLKLPLLGDAMFEALSGGYAARETLAEGEASRLSPGTRSVEAVALISGSAKAVLLLCYDTPRVFDTADRARLARMAEEAVAVWRYAVLAYKSEQRRRATEWLGLVDRSATLEYNLTVLAARLREETKADKVVLYSYDENTRRLQHPPGLAGITPENVKLFTPVDSDEPVYRFHRAGEPQFVADRGKQPEVGIGPLAEREGVRSVALIPLRNDAETAAGIVFLNFMTPQEFPPAHQERLKGIVEAATEAVSVARFHASQRSIRERQSQLMNVPKALAQRHTREEVNREILATAARIFDVEFINLVVIEPNGRLKQEAGLGWADLYPDGALFAAHEAQHALYTIREQDGVPIDDFKSPQLFDVPDAIRIMKIRSGLGVRMMLGDNRVVGAMLVHTKELRRFDETDTFFLRMLATEAAFSHERLRIEELQRREVEDTVSTVTKQSEESKLLAAHHLSEPLNYLSAVLNLTSEGHFGPLTPRLRLALDVAGSGVRNCWRIAQGMLGPHILDARLPAGPTHVARLLFDIVGRWQARALAAHKRIDLDIGNTIDELAAIAELDLTLVMDNLLSNALRAGAADSYIRVRASAGAEVNIDIADDGPGLSPELRAWLESGNPGPLPPGAQAPGRLGNGLRFSRHILRRSGGRLLSLNGDRRGVRVIVPRGGAV